MNKIKRFRLSVRTASVLRGLKALGGVPQPLGLDEKMAGFLGRVDSAAIYMTCPADQAPLWSLEGGVGVKTQPVAVSFYAATIGLPLEEDLTRALSEGRVDESRLLTAFAQEASEQAAQFVTRLILDESKIDACTLSDRHDAEEPAHQGEILSMLEAQRIQILVDAQGHLTPRFTRTGHLLWWPPVRKR